MEILFIILLCLISFAFGFDRGCDYGMDYMVKKWKEELDIKFNKLRR